jgi:hypothetical protein
MEFTDILGNIGTLCFLSAYFMLQNGKIAPTGMPYLAANLAGSILLIISLLFHWNLPAFLLEAAWALISIYGIYRHIYLAKQEND